MAIERKARKAYVSEAKYLAESIDPAWRASESRTTSDGGALAVDADDQPLAKFKGHGAETTFLRQAPGTLIQLAETIELLEKELHEAREERRSYAILSNHLRGAHSHGFTTKNGLDRIKQAHEEILNPTENKPWDW